MAWRALNRFLRVNETSRIIVLLSVGHSFGTKHSGVTESLFGVGGGGQGGVQTFIWGGGARGRHRNDFFLITFIVHNQKYNGGGVNGGDHSVNGRGMVLRPPIVTPLMKQLPILHEVHIHVKFSPPSKW